LTFGQSGQYESCEKYLNLPLCKISHFSEICKYFSYFYSLMLIYSIGKMIKNRKIVVGHFLHGRPSSAPTLAHLLVRSRPAPSASSGRCQVGPGTSRTPRVSLTSSRAGNCHAPYPLPLKPVPFPLLRLCAAHRCNSGRSAALEPCPSAAPLRATAALSGPIAH
jgi:hypothetical protein